MFDSAKLKDQISALQRQLSATPEHRAAMSAALAAANARPEVKARRSAASKARWANPERAARNAAAISAGHARAKAKKLGSVAERLHNALANISVTTEVR
jgi:hypothetical protein